MGSASAIHSQVEGPAPQTAPMLGTYREDPRHQEVARESAIS